MKPWIVAGGGFQGIIAAALLLRRGKRVVLLERAPFLGAVLSSHEQDGLFLDNGCHLFSNEDSETTDLCMEIMQSRINIVDVRYASITEGHRAEELAVADFSHLPAHERARILLEIAKAPGTANSDDFAAVLHARYGPSLAARMRGAVKKMTLREPETLAANTLNKSPFGRVSIAGKGFGSLLKTFFGAFDAALAVPSQRDPMRFYPDAARKRSFRNFYPAEKGTKGFCLAAEKYLRDAGVDIRLGRAVAAISEQSDRIECKTDDGQTFEAEGIVWALDPGALAKILWNADPLQEYSVRVPMVLYYFLVPAETKVNYTYIHDFSPGTHAFRVSSPGFYGQQRNTAGLTYLCAEVPVVMESELWKAPEKIADEVWRQIVDLKMTERDRPDALIVRKTPMSYPLNAPGYAAAQANVTARVAQEHRRIALADPNLFGKVSIARSLAARIEGAAA